MTDDNQTSQVSASAARWVSIVASLLAVVILVGLLVGDSVTEIFGWNVQPTFVGVVLYSLGVTAGRYTQRKTA